MNKPRFLKRIQKRPFSAHHMLIRAAERALDAATKEEKGSNYDLLVVITFSALAIEALCNTVGERIIPNWDDFESSSPMAKLRLLSEHLEIGFNDAGEPWRSARWLMRFRNLIAHAKPENVVEETKLTQEEHDKRLFDIPQSKLEKQITLGNAKRALLTINEIKSILSQKVPTDNAMGLYGDAWSGFTELHPDA